MSAGRWVNTKRTSTRRRIHRQISALAVGVVLAACSGASDEKRTDPPAVSPIADASSASTTKDPRLEEWHTAIMKVPSPKDGCFTASYPGATWIEVPCESVPVGPSLGSHGGKHEKRSEGASQVGGGGGDLTVGHGTDFFAQMSGPIFRATGSFPSVKGDTLSNAYSVQLNSNEFSSALTNTLCARSTNEAGAGPLSSQCNAWQQAAYLNAGSGSGLFFQYRVLNYDAPCFFLGFDWTPDGNDCFMNSASVPNVPLLPVTDLSSMSLEMVAGSSDTIKMSIEGQAYMASFPSVLGLNLGSWNTAEFGVFGPSKSQVNLSPDTSIVTQIVTEPPQNTPTCTTTIPGVATFESNNLSLLPNCYDCAKQCCLTVGFGQGLNGPGIMFEQSNVANQSCSICGGEGQACCSVGNWCASSSDVCYSQTCVHCGDNGELCCSGGNPCSLGNVCQLGACGPPSVLTALPNSLSIEEGDGTTGANTSTTYLYASGLWAEFYPNVSPSLSFSVITEPHGARAVGPGQMPPGINMPVITNDIYPPTVEFSASVNQGGFVAGTYTFEITGTIGGFTATTDLDLNVSACHPFNCGDAHWVCGSFDNGCGMSSGSCGSCTSSAQPYCAGGSCWSCAETTCSGMEYFDLFTCRCKSCPCGTIHLDGHYICNVCKPQAGPLPWWNENLWNFPWLGLTPVAPVQMLVQEGNTVTTGAGFSANAQALLEQVSSGTAQLVLGDDVFSVPLGAQPGAVFVHPSTTSVIGALAQVGGIVNTPSPIAPPPSNPVDPPELVSFDASDGTLFALQVTGTTATLDTVNVSAALQGVVSTGSTPVVGAIPSKPLAMLWDVFTRSLFVMDSAEDGHHAGRGRLRLLTIDPVSGASSLLWQTRQGCDFPDKVLMSVGLQQEISVGLVGVPDHDRSEILLLAASGKPLFSRDVHGRFIGPPHAVPTGVDLAFETHDPALLVDFEHLPQAKLDTGLCGATWLRDNADLQQPPPSVLGEVEANCRHGQ